MGRILPSHFARRLWRATAKNAPGGIASLNKLWSKVKRHSSTLQKLQEYWSQAHRYRRKVCTKRTRSQSRGSGFAPRIAARSAKKRFWYVYFATQSTILALEKSTTRPPAMVSRKKPASLPRGEGKDVPLSLLR